MSDKNTEYDFWNGKSLSANGTISKSFGAFGSKNVRIQIKSDNTFSVDIQWEDGQGNTIRDETDAISGTGGSWSTLDQTAWSPHVTIEVSEDSGSDSTVDANLYVV